MKNYILALFALLFISAFYEKDSSEINNLVTFAKAYGYVKYFHPSNEAANIDWNNFSAFGAKEILKCKNQKEVINTLNQLFQPIGPGIQFSKTKQLYDLEIITPKDIKNYQPTYWQHLGVSTKNMLYQYPQNVYRSVRVNQFLEIDEADQFGYLNISIDAEKYKGKDIKYTGWVKLKPGSKGTGHLLLKVKKPDNSTAFFDNMQGNPITNTEWNHYEIIGEIDDQASRVIIGSYLDGKGTLYVDDVQLFYKENKEWVEIPVKNSDFEDKKIETIYEQSEWGGKDKGYSFEVLNTEKKEGNSCAAIAYEGKFRKEMCDTIFDGSPKFGDLIEKEIGDGIFCQIPLTLYGNSKGTYPKSNSLSKIQKGLDNIEESPNSPFFRIGNVINTYNVFQHFYPYFDVVDVDWSKEFEMALKRSLSDQTGDDHLITLQKFTSPLKDGHIWIRGGDKSYDYAPSIDWQWIEDKLIITQIFDENLNLRIGYVVTKINNLSTEDYFKEVYSRISSATKGHLNYRAQITSLLGEKDTELIIEVNNKTISLQRDKNYDYQFTGIDIQQNDYKLLDKNIFYINLDLIEMDTITKLLPELSKAKGIICDLRGYPNNNHDIISHFINENITVKAWCKIPKIIYPDRENIIGYENSNWGLEAKEPYLGDKEIVFLVDGRTISYAESIMNVIKGYDLATIVGQPTAGTNGNINPFSLLGNYTIRWTGMKVLNPDGSQFHSIGILPDIYVEKTIDGVKSGQDEFLEKAIEIIRERG